MDEAEKKGLREYFKKRYADLNDRYRMLLQQPFFEPGGEVDWAGLNHVSSQLAKQAVLIGTMYRLGSPSAKNMGDCMNTVFNLLQEVLWNVHRALFKAGPTLGKIISSSMKDISHCVLDLVQCAIAYGPYEFSDNRDRISELSAKVSTLHESVKKVPKTNFWAIRRALVRVVIDIKRAISEMESKEGSSSGKPGEEASTSNAGGEEEDVSGKIYTPEEQRAIMQLVISLASGAVEVITVLIRAITEWEFNGVLVAINDIEGLLANSASMSDQVNMIKGCLFPIQRVSKILEALNHINAFISFMVQDIQPYGHTSVSAFHENATVMTNAIQELKTILTD